MRNSTTLTDAIAAVLAVVAVIILFTVGVAIGLAIGGLVFWAAWNLGFVPIAAAAGASVSKIGFLTAVAGSFFLGVVGRLLFGGRRKD